MWSEYLLEPPSEDPDAVRQRWLAWTSARPTWFKRALANSAVAEGVSPEEVAYVLGVSVHALKDYFVHDEPLVLDADIADDVRTLLARALKVPRLAVRLALYELRLDDLFSAETLGAVARELAQRCAAAAASTEAVALAALLKGAGDPADAPRRLYDELVMQRLPKT